MRLSLKIISRNKSGLGSEKIHNFGESGGTIGRSPGADWILIDPDRTISSCHARITFEGGSFCLTDESTNGVFINGATQPIGPQRPVLLRNDDQIRIGDYIILARIAGLEEGDDPETSRLEGLGLEDLLDGADAVTGAGTEKASDLTGDAPQTGARRKRLGDPLSYFAGDGERDEGSVMDTGGTVAAHFSPQGLSARQGLREPFADSPAVPEPGDETLDRYLDQLSGGLPNAAGEEMPPGRSWSLDGVAALPAGQRGMWPLIESLGLEGLVLREEDTAAFLAETGGMMRQAVDGLVRLYTSPVQDGGLRAGETQLRPLEDNPLRLACDTDEALRLLFQNRCRVHLKPQDALRECLDDIMTHNKAVAVGIAEAVQAILQAFSPGTLVSRFRKYGVPVGSDVPGRAQAWDMYEQYFNELDRNAAAGLKRLFRDVFQQAYDRELRAHASFREQQNHAHP